MHLHMQLETGVPSSGGSSFQALSVASPRSRHRPRLLDLRRLSFPTHIFCSVWSLNLNYFLRWFLLVFLLGWKPSLCNAPARWFDLSLWWLLCSPPLLPHAHQYALTTVYLAVPETLEFRVFPMVVTFGLLEQELPFASSRSHAFPRCFFDDAKLRTSTTMQNLQLDPLRSLHITVSPKGNMCLS